MHHVIPIGELAKELIPHSNIIQHRDMTDLWGGVFTINVLASPKTGGIEFQSIERLLGPDPLGQLYIGWSDDFLAVVAEMAGTAKPQKRGVHPFTNGWQANAAVKQSIPWDRLGVGFLFREDPYSQGTQYLVRYKMRFGEYPPMNESL